VRDVAFHGENYRPSKTADHHAPAEVVVARLRSGVVVKNARAPLKHERVESACDDVSACPLLNLVALDVHPPVSVPSCAVVVVGMMLRTGDASFVAAVHQWHCPEVADERPEMMRDDVGGGKDRVEDDDAS